MKRKKEMIRLLDGSQARRVVVNYCWLSGYTIGFFVVNGAKHKAARNGYNSGDWYEVSSDWWPGRM